MLILNGIDMTDEAPAMGETNDHHLRTIVKHLGEDTRTFPQALGLTEVREHLPVLLFLHLHHPQCRHLLCHILNLNLPPSPNLPPRTSPQ